MPVTVTRLTAAASARRPQIERPTVARPEKVAVVDRVTEQFTEAAATLLTDYRGLTVEELADLRARLREVDASYFVVKNTLTRIAAKNAGMDGLDEMLVGPTALVFCGQDPVGPAKALKAFSKDHEALVFKGGYLEGEVLDAEAALKLADLESREDLLSTLAGMMNNALAGFARLLQAPISDMARLMAALESDGGAEAKGFSPSAPVGAIAEEAAAEADEADADADDADADEAPEAATDEADADEAAADDADTDEAPEAAADDAASVDSDDSDDSDSEDSPDSDDSDDADSDEADADEADADEADADEDADDEDDD